MINLFLRLVQRVAVQTEAEEEEEEERSKRQTSSGGGGGGGMDDFGEFLEEERKSILAPVRPEAPGDLKRHYYRVISLNRELRQMAELLMSRVKSVMNLANKHKGTFMEHSYLWTESRWETKRNVRSFFYFFSIKREHNSPEKLSINQSIFTLSK